MDLKQLFADFHNELFSETLDIPVSKIVAELEKFYPAAMKVIQKEPSFFDEERILFSKNISDLSSESKEIVWKHLLPCMICSFFHGDLSKKVDVLSDLIKTIWNSSGQENESISKVLNDENSQSYFKELLDFVLNSRLVKVFKKLVESFDVSDFDLNITDPAELIELLKNPENPVVKSLIEKVKTKVEDKIKKGEIDQNLIIKEVEAIKAKAVALFGNVFNDALGGRKAEKGVSMTSNSPEARRQRMIARMQRKVRDKNSK